MYKQIKVLTTIAVRGTLVIGGNISPGDTAANHYEECGFAVL
jgi:hypothetical protein